MQASCQLSQSSGPGLLARLAILPLLSCSLLLAQEEDDAIRRRVGELMQRLEGLGYSGGLVVAREREVLLELGYGLADEARGKSFDARTVSTVGSISKQFTAAAIVKLWQEGELDVLDSIDLYFHQVPEDKQEISIHHLLTHSSGLPDVLGDDWDLAATREATITGAMSARLSWEPGSRYRYSNLGYSLLGAIIEMISGKGYEQYLREELFLPVGMERTGYLLPEFVAEDLAQGYRQGELWGTVLGRPMLDDGPSWNLRANGGLHSTLGDMYRWHQAISGEGLLHGEYRQAYFAPHIREGRAPSFYAYGWAVFETSRGTRLIAHNGGNGIFSADFHRYVDEDLMLFVSSNRSEFPISLVSGLIARAVFDGDYALPPETVRLSVENLQKYVGSYQLAKGGEMEITRRGSGLSMVTEGDPGTTHLLAASPRAFFSYSIRSGKGLRIEFSADGQSLLLRRGDTEVAARRR